MALKFPDKLQSNNPSAYGIVNALEVSGHKTVSSLSALCNIPDCILSASGNNTDNDAIGQIWYVVDKGELFQLKNWENRKSQDGWVEYGSENVSYDDLQEALDKKQDKLTAGTGIEITEDNVINCTLDTQIFEFVDKLPPLTDAKENKIYLVPKEINEGENQVYVEYIVTNVIDEAGFPTKKWEKIGEYDLSIELAPYLKIADAEATYVKKADIVNTLDGGTEQQVLGAQMGAELKSQIDNLEENTVHSVTATQDKGIIIEGTKNDPTIGILRDPDSEDFLSLGASGLKLSGVQDTIDTGDNKVREEYKTDLNTMQSHTEYLYDINTLFPEQGQGDNKDRWTLTRALTKLDSILTEEDRKSGIKCKFINSDGEWVTYTFYGGDLLIEDNWVYDLTSKDFTELASQIPVATPDSNGMMSAEDKKKFDELKEGIEDGKSIIDEIDEAVKEAKDTIDSYTVNGYKISENPVLTKTDVGLENVTNDAQVKRTEMGVPGGVATLGEDGKVPTTQLPDSVLGNVRYMGTWDASLNEPPLENGNEEDNGHYYVATVAGTQFGYTFDPGDWVINSDGTWSKVDNVDAVKSVNGKIGIVELTIADIPNLTEELASKALNTELQSHLGDYNNPHQVTKDQVGLGNVDNTSDLDKPISEATQAKFDELESHTEVLYNVTNLYPGEGQTGENNEQWDLQHAISKLDGDLEDSEKVNGIKIKFINSEGKWVTYTYEGGDFVSPDSWSYDLTSDNIDDLASLIPTATQDSNGTMSKEDKKILDTLAEGMEDGVSIVDKINEIVEDTKEIIDNYTINGHTISSNPVLDKTDIGLDQVDNTSDLDKPISTATQEALDTIEDETDLVYNINKLFPEDGEGDDTNIWSIQTAISKADSFIPGDKKVPGTKVKFLDENGKWRTYTYYGGAFAEPSNWSYDLTSKDFEELATTNLPTATQEANGVMSKEDKKKLDILTEEFDGETSIADQITEKVEEAKTELNETIDNTKQELQENINNTKEELQSNIDKTNEDLTNHIGDFNNPHQVTKEQVGLGNVTNDAQVKRSEMSIPGGVATLDDNGKVPESQIQERQLQNVKYIGLWSAASNEPKLANNTPERNGDYYVVNTAGEQLGIKFEIGDWVINNGGTWQKVDNTETVTSVNGKIGDVVIGMGDIEGLVDELNSKATNEGLTALKTRVDEIDNSIGQPAGIATLDGDGQLVTTQIPEEAINVLEGSLVNNTTFNNPEGEALAHQKNTIYVDTVTSKIYRWGESSYQELATIAGVSSDLQEHIEDKNNPHQVTKEQVGLGNVTNDAQVKRDEMGEANGVATLDENGKVPVGQLPGQVDEVFGIDQFVSTKTDIPSSRLVVGTTYYVEDEKKIYTALSESELDEGKTPEKGVIYSNRITNLIYRWDGAELVEIGNPVHIGETAGTAYPGDKGKETTDKLNSHLADFANPHQVTKDQIGLGNVENLAPADLPVSDATQEAIDQLKSGIDNYTVNGYKISENPVLTKKDIGLEFAENTADLDKPISTATQAALDKLNEDLSKTITTHVENFNNPHKVSKDQVGLGNVDNTADINKPVSIAQQAAIDAAKADMNSSVTDVKNQLDNHIANKSNPHEVNKSQVGLDKVDNTADLEKPVSIPQQEAIKVVQDSVNSVRSDLSAHLQDYNNPHRVTKANVGLDKVDNTSDLEKPISTATQTALNTLNTNIELAKTEISNYTISGHKISENPILTKADVGLGNVDNTADLEKPISHYTQDALDELEAKIDSISQSSNDTLNAHLQNFNNPHKVTKAQVGLDKVENLAPSEFPVSNATQEAINNVTEIINNHISDSENPHNVTKDQIGLGSVTNDAQVKRDEMGVPGGVATLDQEGKVPSSQLPGFVDDVLEFSNVDEFPETGESGKIYVAKDTNLTYRWSGSRYIEISASLALGETSSTAYPGDKGKDTTDKLNAHLVDYNNPHKVDKAAVGLGNVDNTADKDKPISDAVQGALNEIKTTIEEGNTELGADLNAHIQNYSNPHKVTAAQLGLENVNNTSDLDKPISTATQKALDKITETITSTGTDLSAHLINFDNPHKVSKDQVGLGNVENIAPENMPISTAQQEALDKLETKIEEVEKNQGTDLSAHLTNFNNPHRVTKDQVGLGNVDNTADKDKPVSDATTKAISDAKAELNTALTSHINNKENPHGVTKAQVGLDKVENIAPSDLPVSGPQQTALNNLSEKLSTALENHTTNYSNPHNVTKEQVGLSKVDNTSDVEKPVSAATKELITETKNELEKIINQGNTNLSAHIKDYNNPHQVTKEQIGLGNVENIAPEDMPISNATQDALDNKVDKTEDGLIEESQLPRRTLHSMFYKGFWNADSNSPVLNNGNVEEDGNYYIVNRKGSFFGYEFLPNDVIYNANGNWYRLMGSDARDEEFEFKIIKFVADQYKFEKGSSATINFEWEYQLTPEGQVAIQTINQYTIPVEDRSYSISEITSDTKFVLTSNYKSYNKQAELEVKFYNKFYVGASTKTSVIDSDIQGMDSYFVDGETEAPFKIYDCSGGKYIYVAIPSEVANNYIILCNNIVVNDTVDVTRDVVNASGGRAEYKIMRLTNKYNGTLSVAVKLV